MFLECNGQGKRGKSKTVTVGDFEVEGRRKGVTLKFKNSIVSLAGGVRITGETGVSTETFVKARAKIRLFTMAQMQVTKTDELETS